LESSNCALTRLPSSIHHRSSSPCDPRAVEVHNPQHREWFSRSLAGALSSDSRGLRTSQIEDLQDDNFLNSSRRSQTSSDVTVKEGDWQLLRSRVPIVFCRYDMHSAQGTPPNGCSTYNNTANTRALSKWPR
jgi:hypothetical protein